MLFKIFGLKHIDLVNAIHSKNASEVPLLGAYFLLVGTLLKDEQMVFTIILKQMLMNALWDVSFVQLNNSLNLINQVQTVLLLVKLELLLDFINFSVTFLQERVENKRQLCVTSILCFTPNDLQDALEFGIK